MEDARDVDMTVVCVRVCVRKEQKCNIIFKSHTSLLYFAFFDFLLFPPDDVNVQWGIKSAQMINDIETSIVYLPSRNETKLIHNALHFCSTPVSLKQSIISSTQSSLAGVSARLSHRSLFLLSPRFCPLACMPDWQSP